MDKERRRFLRSGLSLPILATLVRFGVVPAAAAGLDLEPWPREAFAVKGVEEALQALYGELARRQDPRVRIRAEDLVENGAVVPIRIEADLPGVSEIALLAEKNPVPLQGRFRLAPGMEGFIATRVKLAESGRVFAVVCAEDGLHVAHKDIEVTIGGCGG